MRQRLLDRVLEEPRTHVRNNALLQPPRLAAKQHTSAYEGCCSESVGGVLAGRAWQTHWRCGCARVFAEDANMRIDLHR